MNPEPTDEVLFQRFRDGDPDGFRALVGRHRAGVHAFLVRRVGSPHRAEELSQEAFLRAFARESTFQAGRPFKPWLYAIAVNLARAELRNRRPAPLRLETEIGDDPAGGPAAAEPADPGPGPAAAAADEEIRRAVRDAVTTLPEAQQEVVLLSQYQGLSYPEIADITGRPLGTVKSLMHYAVKTLRGRLEPLRRRLHDEP
jgi:RNA polymerase sigma-70 factor (ECF subfamily)